MDFKSSCCNIRSGERRKIPLKHSTALQLLYDIESSTYHRHAEALTSLRMGKKPRNPNRWAVIDPPSCFSLFHFTGGSALPIVFSGRGWSSATESYLEYREGKTRIMSCNHIFAHFSVVSHVIRSLPLDAKPRLRLQELFPIN